MSLQVDEMRGIENIAESASMHKGKVKVKAKEERKAGAHWR